MRARWAVVVDDPKGWATECPSWRDVFFGARWRDVFFGARWAAGYDSHIGGLIFATKAEATEARRSLNASGDWRRDDGSVVRPTYRIVRLAEVSA